MQKIASELQFFVGWALKIAFFAIFANFGSFFAIYL
jgi:hypothetical protein